MKFGRELVLAEEMGKIVSGGSTKEAIKKEVVKEEAEKSTIVVEKNDFRVDAAFQVQDETTKLPIEGPGELEQFIAIADKEFKIKVFMGNRSIINNSYSELAKISTQVGGISAYEQNGDYQVSVGGYSFKDPLDIILQVDEETFFDIVRLDVTVR